MRPRAACRKARSSRCTTRMIKPGVWTPVQRVAVKIAVIAGGIGGLSAALQLIATASTFGDQMSSHLARVTPGTRSFETPRNAFEQVIDFEWFPEQPLSAGQLRLIVQ